MPIVESGLAPVLPSHAAQLLAAATSARPAWLWSADGARIIWANAVGAAIFGLANASERGKRRFGAGDPAPAQIARLAAALPCTGQERLERLRGFGADFGRALTCTCARLVLPDGVPAVFLAAIEPAGPALPLAERVRRLLSDSDKPLAAFMQDGRLLHANPAAAPILGSVTTLAALGLAALAAVALEIGQTNGRGRFHQTDVEVGLQRLGKDESCVLVLTMPPAANARSRSPDRHDPYRHGQDTEAATAAEPHAEPAPPAPIAAVSDLAVAERRHPLRFIWQMDAEGRFVIGSDEFTEFVGPRTIAVCGRLWSEIAADLKLDDDNQVARALARRETWSGIPISWPVDETSERLPVELSGLPVFDRNRVFRGYRGFGVCRDLARITQLARGRRARPVGFAAAAVHGEDGAATGPTVAETAESGALDRVPAAQQSEAGPDITPANVVPFRASAAPEVKAPSLSAVERNAFRELAQELTARLRGTADAAVAAGAVEALPGEMQHVTAAAVAAAQVAADTVAVAVHAPDAARQQPHSPAWALLDRVPAGVLVYRDGGLYYANRRFLELSGYDNLQALAAAGGLDGLFAEPRAGMFSDSGAAQRISIRTARGAEIPVDGRLFTVPWDGPSALALILTGAKLEQRQNEERAALESAHNEIRELKSNLERTARREAQKAAAAKADFLAKVSHEIRTPLNAMIGFAEVIMAERFGRIGNERYREYLKDIHAAGTHLVASLNDLIELSKIESGQLDLHFDDVELNEITEQCVMLMQPQANGARIIIRSSLTPGLPKVVADARSLRQIALNLIGHAIKFTGPGGQVIVSTALTDGGEVVLRVRHAGVAIRGNASEMALDRLGQPAASSGRASDGSGLGLALTRALAEANCAHFSTTRAPNVGTLVEIAFPSRLVNAH